MITTQQLDLFKSNPRRVIFFHSLLCHEYLSMSMTLYVVLYIVILYLVFFIIPGGLFAFRFKKRVGTKLLLAIFV